MSDYHFTSTSIYKKRLVQLGENKSNIFMTGSLATDNIHNLKLKSKRDLEKLYNFNFASKNILISFHPDTSVSNYDAHDFEILLKSLKKIKNTLLIFTYPNSDKGSDIIINKINNFINNNQNSFVIKSLGQVNYFSLVKYIDFFVGNSSSGITEIPLFKKLTINIGRRQNGRLMSSSVITLPAKVKTIDKTLNMALSDKYRISHDKIYFKTKGATKKMYNLLFKIYNYKKKLKIFEDIK
jgi:GDP/UDP-N,N'-diacetylbacillosamine 2-epimerase (hydrolysing)